jgi:hypothetical protein
MFVIRERLYAHSVYPSVYTTLTYDFEGRRGSAGNLGNYRGHRYI